MLLSTTFALALLFNAPDSIIPSQPKAQYIQVYTGWDYQFLNYQQPRDSVDVLYSDFRSFDFGKISVAYASTQKNSRQEWGLSLIDFGWQKRQFMMDYVSFGSRANVDGEAKFYIKCRLYYEHSWLLTPSLKRTKIYLGAVYRPYLDYYKIVPATSTAFPHDILIIGHSLGSALRMEYHLKGPIFLSTHLFIPVLDNYFLQHQEHNPILPFEQQRFKNAKVDFFARNISWRIGLSIRL